MARPSERTKAGDFEQSILCELVTPGIDLDGATEIVIHLLARCRGTRVLEGEDTGEVSKTRAELRGELRKMVEPDGTTPWSHVDPLPSRTGLEQRQGRPQGSGRHRRALGATEDLRQEHGGDWAHPSHVRLK